MEAEIKRITEDGEQKGSKETLVKAAAAMGYSISIEELERAEADMELLDDNELDSVSGGDTVENWCIMLWYCFIAFMPS